MAAYGKRDQWDDYCRMAAERARREVEDLYRRGEISQRDAHGAIDKLMREWHDRSRSGPPSLRDDPLGRMIAFDEIRVGGKMYRIAAPLPPMQLSHMGYDEAGESREREKAAAVARAVAAAKARSKKLLLLTI